MSDSTQFLTQHGLPFVFAAVFLEQIGLPLPAFPWLLGAGALAATGHVHLSLGIMVAVIACLVADTFWFYLGRYRGNQVLGLLCRISLEPDSCVRRTLNVFTRYGWRGIVAAKFLPGMSTITPPVAGMSGIAARRFLFFDGLGSLLYCGLFVLVGYFFSNQIAQIGRAVTRIGGGALSLLIGFSALYIAYKFWQRQRLLHELRMARITVDELHQKLDAADKPFILDLRSRAELELSPTIICGAIQIELKEVVNRRHEFPQDREIVLYCSCPNEVSSARVALELRRQGFTRVRPLQGGIEAWRKKNYPVETWTAIVTTKADSMSLRLEPTSVETSKEPILLDNKNQDTTTNNGQTS
jgi:membrane protein DedA with SNARE-associated domain/rhodanese-related sulfurtransferase